MCQFREAFWRQVKPQISHLGENRTRFKVKEFKKRYYKGLSTRENWPCLILMLQFHVGLAKPPPSTAVLAPCGFSTPLRHGNASHLLNPSLLSFSKSSPCPEADPEAAESEHSQPRGQEPLGKAKITASPLATHSKELGSPMEPGTEKLNLG